MIYVKEATGVVVKNTRGKRVPSGIFSVDETCPYWRSFLKTGDLVRATDEEITDAKSAKAAKVTASPAGPSGAVAIPAETGAK